MGIMGDWECFTYRWDDHKGSRQMPRQMGEGGSAVLQILTGL